MLVVIIRLNSSLSLGDCSEAEVHVSRMQFPVFMVPWSLLSVIPKLSKYSKQFVLMDKISYKKWCTEKGVEKWMFLHLSLSEHTGLNLFLAVDYRSMWKVSAVGIPLSLRGAETFMGISSHSHNMLRNSLLQVKLRCMSSTCEVCKAVNWQASGQCLLLQIYCTRSSIVTKKEVKTLHTQVICFLREISGISSHPVVLAPVLRIL